MKIGWTDQQLNIKVEQCIKLASSLDSAILSGALASCSRAMFLGYCKRNLTKHIACLFLHYPSQTICAPKNAMKNSRNTRQMLVSNFQLLFSEKHNFYVHALECLSACAFISACDVDVLI